MIALRLAAKLAWCVIAGHDLRERQHSVRCWTCWPSEKRKRPYVLTPEGRALLDGIAKDANADA